MSLRDHMEGVKELLASGWAQEALKRLMEEALREKVEVVYKSIKWTESDDNEGMSFPRAAAMDLHASDVFWVLPPGDRCEQPANSWQVNPMGCLSHFFLNNHHF